MSKTIIADEVQVLRFFEQGSIEKAEVLFNIVSEKMRERLRGTDDSRSASHPTSVSTKRRESPASRKAPAVEVPERSPAE
jgi:hypothetical protein